jgi:biopolymer transport protein ExbD
MYFERQVRKTRAIPLVSLIDIMFFLLLFFMLSTSFVRTESLELTLPDHADGQVVSPTPTVAAENVTQIYITAEGEIYLGHELLAEKDLINRLLALFKEKPEQSILLLIGEKVSVQQMIQMMDRIYQLGGKSISVESWSPPVSKTSSETSPNAEKREG